MLGNVEWTRTLAVNASHHANDFHAFGSYINALSVIQSAEAAVSYNMQGWKEGSNHKDIHGDVFVELQGAFDGYTAWAGTLVFDRGAWEGMGNARLVGQNKGKQWSTGTFFKTDVADLSDIWNSASSTRGHFNLELNEDPLFGMAVGLMADGSLASTSANACVHADIRFMDYLNASTEVVVKQPGSPSLLMVRGVDVHEAKSNFDLHLSPYSKNPRCGTTVKAYVRVDTDSPVVQNVLLHVPTPTLMPTSTPAISDEARFCRRVAKDRDHLSNWLATNFPGRF